MPTRICNGTTLFYEDQGDGEPLVLVHGSWADHTNWDLVAGPLARTHRVVRYDRRGHGQSTAPPEDGSVQDDLADLGALIEDLGLAPANLVGNSFGACISLRLAGERPDLVRRLAGHEPPMFGVLVGDPSMQPLLDGRLSATAAVIRHLEDGQDAEAAEVFVEQVAPGSWAALPEPIRATFVRNARTFLGETRDPDGLTIDLETLRRYPGPVLLSQGDQSPPMFAAVITTLCSALPKSQHRVLAGAGHVPQMTHPEQYVDLLSSFLSS